MLSPSALVAALAVAGTALTATALVAGPDPVSAVSARVSPGTSGADRSSVERRSAPVWAWPLAPRPRVVRAFVAPRSDYGPGHRGLDLGGAAGAEVRAVNDGLVVHAGQVAGRGTVTVRHGSGLESTYEPLDVRVSRGTRVSTGDMLGMLSSSAGAAAHCGPVSCLHLGARREGTYLDPFPLLAGGRVVLLPLPGGMPPT